jgi:hypothetical protein
MAYPTNTDALITSLKEQLDTELGNGRYSSAIDTLEKLQNIRLVGSGGGGGGGASAPDIGNAVNGTPINGQSLETGGNGGTGWLSSLRKAVTDRLPASLGTKTAALSVSTTDATPPLSIISTPHGAGGITLAAGAAASNVNPVVVDINSLVQRGEFSVGFTIAGNGTSPGAGTLTLKWAYSSENVIPDAAFVAGFVSGSVNSLSASIVAQSNQSLRGIVRDLALARYLYLWFDVPTIAASATLTVTTRVVAT